MIKRTLFGGSLLLLLVALAFPLGGSAAASTLAGTFTSGTDTVGHHYGFDTLSGLAKVTSITVAFAPGTTSAMIQCDVPAPNPNHGVGDPKTPYAWQSFWSLSAPTGSVTVNVVCTTQWVRIDVDSAPVPTAVTASGTLVSAATATSMPMPTATRTLSPTATTIAPSTATTVPMPTGTMPASQNTCGDAPAVDQNGVSVDVWAPGLRIACGYKGYENGDNPMPPGTLMPAPRPFRFDSVIDHNEPVFGFKVFYRPGSEAPAGYGGVNGCGDVRTILHQGGDTHGMMTEYHTYQYTEVRCDAQGKAHIIDIGGQIDTGPLYPRDLPDSGRPDGPNRLTASTLSCNGKTTFICATVWYSFFNYALPGASNTGFSHLGSLVENPIALYNAADPMGYYPGVGDGTTTMLRDVQRYVPAHNASDWCAMWNTSTHVNEVTACSTPGSWHQHVDTSLNESQILEPASGTDHPHAVRGIIYQN